MNEPGVPSQAKPPLSDSIPSPKVWSPDRISFNDTKEESAEGQGLSATTVDSPKRAGRDMEVVEDEAQDETLEAPQAPRQPWAGEAPEEACTLRTLEDFLAEADAETQQASEPAPPAGPAAQAVEEITVEPLEEKPSELRGEGKRPPPLRELVGISKRFR